VIDTPVIRRMGLRASALERWLLTHRRTRHLARAGLALRSAWSLKRGARSESSSFWQAGRSVAAIDRIEPAGAIVRKWAELAQSGL